MFRLPLRAAWHDSRWNGTREARDAPDPADGSRRGLFFQGPEGRPRLVFTGALERAFAAADSAVGVLTAAPL